MAQFVLFLHEKIDSFSQLSPQEMQCIIEEYTDWRNRLGASGKILDGKKLKDEAGRRLRLRGDRLEIDGPFTETKEIIGGLFIMQAENYDEAVELCRDCPHLAYGGTIELREIDEV